MGAPIRPAVRSYANVAAMPANLPAGSIAYSQANSAFAVYSGGVWNLLAAAGNATSLQGRPVSAAAPGAGEVLEWNGAAWAPAVTGDATSLQGNPVSAAAPGAGQVLEWNGAAWVPTALAASLSGALLFGSGRDGSLAAGFGVVTLTRDTYFLNITFQAGDRIITAGNRLFCSGILDVSAADTGAVSNGQTAGVAGVTGAGGGAGGAAGSTSVANARTLGTGVGGGGGGNGGAGGAPGDPAAGTAATDVAVGAEGGASGSGGAGMAAGGLGGAASTITNPWRYSGLQTPLPIVGGVPVVCKAGTTGRGGGGGGSGTATIGGGGGGGGAAGCNLEIFAAVIARGANVTPAIFDATGKPGAVGGRGDDDGATGSGGGGAGAGGGGGHALVVVGSRTGVAIPGGIDASGGAGGGGGDGGIGVGLDGGGGNGGDGGSGGQIVLMDLSLGTVLGDTDGAAGAAGAAAAGRLGGVGGVGGNSSRDL